MKSLGIDPGKTGALCLIDDDGKILRLEKFPLTGTDYDIPGLFDLIRDLLKGVEWAEVHVFYEALHPMPMAMGGVKTNFSRGYIKGVVEAALCSLRLKSSPVRAQAWQKLMFAGMTVAKGESKAAALMAARRLWPNQVWTFGPRATKPHDGAIDAALIAEYGRREFS